MAVDRRQFLAGAGTAIAASAALAPGSVAARTPGARARTLLTEDMKADAPPELERSFRSLLQWMSDGGWADHLRRETGFDLRSAIATEGAIFEELQSPMGPDFAEFGGRRAIQPGDPAMSLLYHALASASVRPLDSQGRVLPATAFPQLAQIDLLENYIHARARAPGDLSALLPAVFAYEYRPSSKTPHGRHADLVYARTGVSRTGTHPARFDPVHRTHLTEPADTRRADTAAVTPARFGLFLARRMAADETSRIGINSLDDELRFLVPVRKLYNGSPDLQGFSLTFAESHRDEKLARLAGQVTTDPRCRTDEFPFVRTSASRAGHGATSTLSGHDTALVELRAESGLALVVPAHGPLVELAKQGTDICRFRVPRATEGSDSNRRYTSLRLVEDPSALAWNFILSDWIFGGGRYTTGLRAPQNVPAFVNIRHLVEDNGQVVHLGESSGDLGVIRDGGYWAAMFTDGLCDGCVTAELSPPAGGPASMPHPQLPWREVLPGFSIVAAPDFFPQFDPNDLARFDIYFFEGGTETTSGGRLRANPFIQLPGRPEPAFPLTSDRRIAATITAALSLPPTSEIRRRRDEPRRLSINTLPDTISHVFAPGWDVTYSNDPDTPDSRFLATFGLGSPFPEDMKLCAAANGMWAGSSPDAARTFYPDLVPFKFVGRPATAVPLVDAELGFHPDSSAALEHDADRRPGWDGEYGPYLVIEQDELGRPAFAVNYADMMLSDYVANSTRGEFDLGRLRQLDEERVLERMNALGRCIRRLPGLDRVRSTDLWLVSAEEVADWGSGADGLGIPGLLGLHGDDRRIAAAPGIGGTGWLYLFAREQGRSVAATQQRRRVQPCRRIYVCQIANAAIRYAQFDSRRQSQAGPRWR